MNILSEKVQETTDSNRIPLGNGLYNGWIMPIVSLFNASGITTITRLLRSQCEHNESSNYLSVDNGCYRVHYLDNDLTMGVVKTVLKPHKSKEHYNMLQEGRYGVTTIMAMAIMSPWLTH